MKLSEHFQKARKAQLQEYFLRWFPDDDMISDMEKLRERLAGAMSDAQRIRERFDRLNKSGQDFLAALLTCQQYRGSIEPIRQIPRAQSNEGDEIENLVRTLIDEGWIVATTVANNGHRAEEFELFKEIGDGLRVTVNVESRDALVMLSLENFIAANGGDRLSDEAVSYTHLTLPPKA